MARLKWYGKALKARMEKSSIVGINRTMGESVGYAKGNHPWQNQTVTLEPGIRMVAPAAIKGTKISGLWGVANVYYAKFLERNPKWRWLAPTAEKIYPRLAANIQTAFASDHRRKF